MEGGVVTEEALRAMLQTTGEDDVLLPSSAEAAPWPLALGLGAPVSGTVDGLSDPSPSGAPPRPDNGIDAIRVHRVTLPRAGTLVLTLRIQGRGDGADHTDLDLQLWSRRAEGMATADGPGATHELRRELEAGTYVVVVRDAGSGNRADYTLEARLD